MNEEYLLECEKRRMEVERAIAIINTATNGPDQLFMNALEHYIFGFITLEELQRNVDDMSYL